ncbi:STAS/SEC14 domain-containing protein [Chondromyces apiculatus]|uniref:STAS/SEC14 domain-containing protein n=1 Tax=Chondromyces apiculatus DSM 436 TaxID=1192034 RepID=A0A017T9W9_9BACT|nr:STAS/SEC14 domain-containing protein [Chondromyces apiculatus]EYF05737.1 Hypothetical protein CAP_3027 [Chondromyces apiculatus DSM 436]
MIQDSIRPPDLDEDARPSSPGTLPGTSPGTSTGRRMLFGRHMMIHEPPDLHVVRLEGTLTPDQILAMAAANERYIARATYMLLLIDLRSHWTAPAETRRTVASLPRRSAPRFFAFLGGSFTSRLLVKVVIQASSLFAPGKMNAAFFEDEATARAWLHEHRKQFTGSGG